MAILTSGGATLRTATGGLLASAEGLTQARVTWAHGPNPDGAPALDTRQLQNLSDAPCIFIGGGVTFPCPANSSILVEKSSFTRAEPGQTRFAFKARFEDGVYGNYKWLYFYDPVTPEVLSILVEPSIDYGDARAGSSVNISPVQWTGGYPDPIVSSHIQTAATIAGEYVPEPEMWSVNPASAVGRYAQFYTRIDDGVTVIERLTTPVLILPALETTPGIWAPSVASSQFWPVLPSGQNVYFRPSFTPVPGRFPDEMEWSTGTAGAGGMPGPNQNEPIIVDPENPDRLIPQMRNAGLRAPTDGTFNNTLTNAEHGDYAIFREDDVLRRTQLFRTRARFGVNWSNWSNPIVIPTPAAAPIVPTISAIPSITMQRGTTQTFDASRYVQGSGIAYSIASPAWATVNAAGLVTLSEPNNRTYPITTAVTLVATNSAGSASRPFNVTAQDEELDDAARLWRPYVYRAQAIFNQPADQPSYYRAGRYWGEGFQYAHCFEREGNRIVFGGDMCGFRMSDDGGITWFWPWEGPGKVTSQGLRGNVFHSVAIDPSDHNTILVATSASNFSPNYPSAGAYAIYRSTDGGRNFTQAQAVTNLYDRQKMSLSMFCCVRSGTDPLTRAWGFMEDKAGVAGVYWRSANGGQTWSRAAALPAELANSDINGIVQHPTFPATQYATTSAGLWRTTNNGGSWSRIGNGAGKLARTIQSLWIDPDTPGRMLCSMTTSSRTAQDGAVFFTTSGGATAAEWSAVLTGAADVAPTSLSVGPLDSAGRRTIYLMQDRNAVSVPKPWIQHWLASAAPASTKAGQLAAGAAAPNGTWFMPRVTPSASGVNEQHWNEICGAGQGRFVPDEANAQNCTGTGYGIPWRTSNRGADWIQSNTNFGGMNSQGIGFDSSNVNRMVLALNDVQAAATDASPDYMTEMKITAAQRTALEGQADYSGSGYHGKHAIILPSHASLPVAARGRLLASIGSYAGEQSIYRKNRLANAWESNWVTVVNPVSDVPELFYSAANPNIIYGGRLRSLDGGDNFTANALAYKAMGCSQQNPAIVFGAASGDTTIMRNASYGATSGTINGVAGAAWSTWYAGTRKLSHVERKIFAWLSPHDATKMVIHTNTGDLALYGGTTTGSLLCNINLSAAYAALGFTGTLPINVACGDWCSLNPRRFYFHAKMFGRPMVWRITFNSGFTAVASIEDISRNSPSTANNRQLKVHPITGEVFISSGGGVWVIPAPGAVPSDAIWRRMPEPIRSTGVAGPDEPDDPGEPEDPDAVFTSAPSLAFTTNPPTQGDTVTLTEATISGSATVTYTYRRRSSPTGAITTGASGTDLIAAIDGNVELSVLASMPVGLATPAEISSPWYQVTDPDALKRLLASDITMTVSNYSPSGQTTTFTPVVEFPGLAGETVYERQWTAADISNPDPVWHPMVAGTGSTFILRDVNHPVAPGAFDAALFRADEVDRRGRWRMRWQEVSGGPWSDVSDVKTVPMPVSAPSVTFPTPATAWTTEAMAESSLRYTIANPGGGWAEGSVLGSFGKHCPVMVAAAAFAGVTATFGGMTPKAKLLGQLQYWSSATSTTVQGNAPSMSGGYSFQYAQIFVTTVQIAKLMSDVWNDLSADQRNRLDLLMKGALVAGAWVAADANPYNSSNNLDDNRSLTGNQAGIGLNPNFAYPHIFIPYQVAAYMGNDGGTTGAQKATNYLNTFTVASFLSDVNAAGGLKDMYDVFNRAYATGIPNGAGAYKGVPPTATALQNAVRDYRHDGNTLANPTAVFAALLDRNCARAIKRGLDASQGRYESYAPSAGGWGSGVWEPVTLSGTPRSGSGRGRRVGCLVAGAPNPPGMGTQASPVLGNMFEMSTSDAEGPRSSLFYGIASYRSTAYAGLGLLASGALDRSNVALQNAVAQMDRAVAVAKHFVQHGYEDYSKGGQLYTNSGNATWPAGASPSGVAPWKLASNWGMHELLSEVV